MELQLREELVKQKIAAVAVAVEVTARQEETA